MQTLLGLPSTVPVLLDVTPAVTLTIKSQRVASAVNVHFNLWQVWGSADPRIQNGSFKHPRRVKHNKKHAAANEIHAGQNKHWTGLQVKWCFNDDSNWAKFGWDVTRASCYNSFSMTISQCVIATYSLHSNSPLKVHCVGLSGIHHCGCRLNTPRPPSPKVLTTWKTVSILGNMVQHGRVCGREAVPSVDVKKLILR